MSGRKGLLVDYGGVLTRSLGAWFARADKAASLPRGTVLDVVVAAYRQPEGDSFVHRLERGELDLDGFRAQMTVELARLGHDVDGADVMGPVLEGFTADGESPLWDVVLRARLQGVATGLLSNSWGTDGYPLERLQDCFEDLVISGRVGLRKPDPAIFLLACERLSVEPADCIFVDDFEVNVVAAERLGMTGVLHTGDADATTAALEDFLGLVLRT